jgi:hypothetical protein
VGGGGLEGGGAQGWLKGLIVGGDSFCMPSGLGWQLWPLHAISSGGWGEGDGGRLLQQCLCYEETLAGAVSLRLHVGVPALGSSCCNSRLAMLQMIAAVCLLLMP